MSSRAEGGWPGGACPGQSQQKGAVERWPRPVRPALALSLHLSPPPPVFTQAAVLLTHADSVHRPLEPRVPGRRPPPGGSPSSRGKAAPLAAPCPGTGTYLGRLVEEQAEVREHHPQLLPPTAVLEFPQQSPRQLILEDKHVREGRRPRGLLLGLLGGGVRPPA